MEMGSEKFYLKWNDFKSNLSEALQDLREEKDFFDVTLACEDNQIQAHKVILSACSPLFRNILRRNPHQHPLLYLKDVRYKELLSVINFMYIGEVSVAQDELNLFLNAAEELRVKGLTQSSERTADSNSDSKRNVTDNIKNKDDRWKSVPAPSHVTSRRNNQQGAGNIARSTEPPLRNQEQEELQDVSFIKTEPREIVQQRAPVRPYQDQYGHHVQQDHHLALGQTYEDAGEQGTVAVDENYIDDGGYDYQYEASGENYSYDEQAWQSKGQ